MSGDVRSRRGVAGVDPESQAIAGDDDDDARGSARQLRLPVALATVVITLFFVVYCIFSLNSRPPPTAVHAAAAPDADREPELVERAEQVAQAEEAEPAPSPSPPPPPPPPAPTQTPAPAPPEAWRHAVQQEANLPSGPEHPAHEPPSSIVMVRCATTTGPITVEVRPDWAPNGAKRFLDMVQGGFFSSKVTLFRSVKGFLCQTGVAGDPAVTKEWKAKGNIEDDPQWLDLKDSKRMKRGYLSFAGGGKNSRGVEFFFAYKDLGLGTSPWEVPFGKLVGKESYENFDHWYTGYGDIPAFGGHSPQQGQMYSQGVKYVEEGFPEIDYITACDVVQGEATE